MAAPRLTRAERTAATRRDLLDAAERLFFLRGYHATTVDDIVAEAGFTKGAVYSTFKSKAGLFLELFDEVVERRVAAIAQLLSAHETPEERLRALAQQPDDDRNAQFLLLSIEFWVHAAREPELLAAFAERYRRLRAQLAELAPPESPLAPERWALVTLALSNGLALERIVDPAGVPDDVMASVQLRLAQPEPAS